MKQKILCLIIALLAASCGSEKVANLTSDIARETSSVKVTLQSVLSELDKASFRKGELLVRFRQGVTNGTAANVHSSLGATVIRNFGTLSNLQHVRIPAGMSEREAVTLYMSNANVEYAEPNYLHTLARTPNDEYFNPQQWAINNTGTFASGTAGADVKAQGAWDSTTGSGNIVIAVLDSGVDYTHPDLAGNIWTNPSENPMNGLDDDGNGYVDDWRGWNFVFFDKNENGLCDRNPENLSLDEDCHDPMDFDGHGTHVSGIIGAVGNNSLGVAGMMWHVKIMPLKVCSDIGCPTDAIIEGIEYAVSKQVKVINASLRGYQLSFAARDAIALANSNGVLFVASAGNEAADVGYGNNDISPAYPASFNLPNIISVAASDQNDRLATFSNFGLNSVHLAAPGVYILSTVPYTFTESPHRSEFIQAKGYAYFDGTSMAAPHVTGLAGLLYSYYPTFTYTQVKSTILHFVDVKDSFKGLVGTGGRMDAYKSLSSLWTPWGLSATAASSSQITLSWTDAATGEDSYRIERKANGGAFVEIATVGANSTGYTDSGLPASTAYAYRVRAFNHIGNSAYSNEASATTLAPDAVPSGDGGNCSIGARQNVPTALGNFAVLAIPLVVLLILRRKQQK